MSAETPQILLAHHLKALKLPTFLREYDKLARQCATEGVDHTRYLQRLAELELIDRERRLIERRIKAAKFPAVKSLDSFDFKAIPSLNKVLVLDLARSDYVARNLAALIRRDRPDLSLSRQCHLLSISRSSFYYAPKGESPKNLALMRRIDALFLKYPFFGSRQMARQLRREGVHVGRHRVRRLMRLMGLEAIYQAPRTSAPHSAHRVYPYLLRDMTIDRPNQVWCADITYIPVQRGFLYLVAIMDWATRQVLAWRLSNTMDARFCVEALNEALARYGKPEIFNTDQGSQFTSADFTDVLKNADIRISMDGRGRCMDNIFIERLWRSLKYEAVYLHELTDGFVARRVIGGWIDFYTTKRPHSALDGKTPEEAYWANRPVDMMDKPIGLPTSPQTQQQQKAININGMLAA